MNNSHGVEIINDDECRRMQASVEFVGRKWNSAILLAGVRGARRFSEYRALIEGISDRMLTARLQELEREGLIERHVQPSTPVLITYTLTESGRELIAVLQPLVQWSADRQRADAGKDPAGLDTLDQRRGQPGTDAVANSAAQTSARA